MVWFVVDDVLPFHHRILEAGNAAMGLWVRAGAWSSGQLTDGFIPTAVAKQLGSAKEIRTLVTVGLWLEQADGYQFHAWAEDGTGQKRQQTRAEVEEKRRKERDRKAAYREDQRANAERPETPETSPKTAPVPAGVPLGHPTDVRAESQWVSALPSHTKPYLEDQRQRSADADLSLDGVEGTRSTKPAYPPAFEEFWARYPRREGKAAALKAWRTARRNATDAELLEGADRYREDPNREPAYTKHPSTWLRAGSWVDEPLPPRTTNNGRESSLDRRDRQVAQTFADLAALELKAIGQ